MSRIRPQAIVPCCFRPSHDVSINPRSESIQPVVHLSCHECCRAVVYAPVVVFPNIHYTQFQDLRVHEREGVPSTLAQPLASASISSSNPGALHPQSSVVRPHRTRNWNPRCHSQPRTDLRTVKDQVLLYYLPRTMRFIWNRLGQYDSRRCFGYCQLT